MGVKKTHTVATLSAAEASEISQHFSKLSALFEKISKNVVPIAEGPKKVVRDPNAPKKPLSAYILFCNDFREEVKDRQPGLSSQGISIILGEMWTSLTPDVKKKYEDRYKKDKEAYTIKNQLYQSTKASAQQSATDSLSVLNAAVTVPGIVHQALGNVNPALLTNLEHLHPSNKRQKGTEPGKKEKSLDDQAAADHKKKKSKKGE